MVIEGLWVFVNNRHLRWISALITSWLKWQNIQLSRKVSPAMSEKNIQLFWYSFLPIQRNTKLWIALLGLFCLFGVFVPFEKFSLIWRRHHYRGRVTNFDLIVCSALVAIEQWGGCLACYTYCDTGHPLY